MNVSLIIAKKEISDAIKNKLFIIILGMLFLLTVVSIILSAYQVNVSLNEYNKTVDFLKSIGKTSLPPMPPLNPLAASKSFVNYIGMLGALLAIVLGNLSMVKETRGGTLRLILSRQIFRDKLLNGKLIGNLTILLTISASLCIITFLTLIIGGIPLTMGDVFRTILFFSASFLFMSFFLILGIFFAVVMGNGNKALLITIIIWLILSFVLPQIGDTMDMDNQLPGGFFAQMGISKDEQTKILLDFKFYETARDSIEEMSPLKHYERMSFALLNVKPGFETLAPFEVVFLKWINLIGLTIPSIILWLIAYMVFLRREDIY